MRNICEIVETAITNLYASSSNWPEDVNIYKGQDNEDKEAPCVIVNASSAEDVSPPARVWNVTTEIITKEMAADSSSDAVDTIADFAETLLFVSGSQLASNASNLYVADIFSQGIQMQRTGEAWTQTLTVNIYCKRVES